MTMKTTRSVAGMAGCKTPSVGGTTCGAVREPGPRAAADGRRWLVRARGIHHQPLVGCIHIKPVRARMIPSGRAERGRLPVEQRGRRPCACALAAPGDGGPAVPAFGADRDDGGGPTSLALGGEAFHKVISTDVDTSRGSALSDDGGFSFNFAGESLPSLRRWLDERALVSSR